MGSQLSPGLHFLGLRNSHKMGNARTLLDSLIQRAAWVPHFFLLDFCAALALVKIIEKL